MTLRSDARLNQDRVLEAAAAIFAAGGDTSLKAIAREAGVGIATLYRRFPTREQLIEAVYRNETTALAESAATLLESETPPVALRAWFGSFLDYMATKEGMAEALPAILADRDGLRLHSRDVLRDAISRILAAGAADGSLRAGLDPDDVMMAIGGVALITAHEHQRDLGSRLAGFLIDAFTSAAR
ncbi:MAG TPA: TetR family transcriptional regulator [Micromonosporaceae bacterium]|jgi:AcrR family transcriptional regulator